MTQLNPPTYSEAQPLSAARHQCDRFRLLYVPQVACRRCQATLEYIRRRTSLMLVALEPLSSRGLRLTAQTLEKRSSARSTSNSGPPCATGAPVDESSHNSHSTACAVRLLRDGAFAGAQRFGLLKLDIPYVNRPVETL